MGGNLMNKKEKKKRAIAFLLVFCLLVLGSGALLQAKVIRAQAPGKKVARSKDKASVIDYSNISKGYVVAKYNKSTKSKLKAQVKCPNGVTYTYNLPPKKWGMFPLSEGNGTYKVTMFKNVSGNSYSVLVSQSFKVKMTNTRAPFLMANSFVDYTTNTMCVKKAASLCKGQNTEMKKVKKIYEWTIKYFKYDEKKAKTVKSGYIPNLDKVYKAKKGICFDYAATMTAMLRSQGIATKLVVGYAGSAYHAWISVYSSKDGWLNNVIYFDGKNWNLMDPTFASSSNSSKSVMKYIGNGKNYKQKYAY